MPPAFALAREVGVPIVQHLVGNDLSTPLIELGRAGLLRPGDEYIHCLGIDDAAAWRLIKDSGGHVSICAPNRYGDGPERGMPAIQEALDHGLRPSLSSDLSRVTIAQDFFIGHSDRRSALRRLLMLQRARKGDRSLPPLLSCRDVLEFAAVAGARLRQS